MNILLLRCSTVGPGASRGALSRIRKSKALDGAAKLNYNESKALKLSFTI